MRNKKLHLCDIVDKTVNELYVCYGPVRILARHLGPHWPQCRLDRR